MNAELVRDISGEKKAPRESPSDGKTRLRRASRDQEQASRVETNVPRGQERAFVTVWTCG